MIAVANFIGLPLLFLSTTMIARPQMPDWMQTRRQVQPGQLGRARRRARSCCPARTGARSAGYLFLLLALSAVTAGVRDVDVPQLPALALAQRPSHSRNPTRPGGTRLRPRPAETSLVAATPTNCAPVCADCGTSAVGWRWTLVLFGRPTQPAAAVTWQGTGRNRGGAIRGSAGSCRLSGLTALLGRSIAQIVWPFVTAAPGATARSATTPARCAATSFSIFIASTMQITWPDLDHVARRRPSTSSTVPCIGLTTASPAAPPAPRSRALAPPARERRGRAAPGRAPSPRRGGRRPRPPSCARRVACRTTAVRPAATVVARCESSRRLRRQLARTRRGRGTSRRRRSTDARAAPGGSRSASSTPPISNSPSARSIRRRAVSRSTPWTISFAIIGS